MTTLYYNSVNHQTHFQNHHMFLLNTPKYAANDVISFEVYDGFIGQKILKLNEGRKVPPWLFCQYNESSLVDLPCSMIKV